MLLVMRNLPSDIKYSDIKSLIQTKCFVGEVILDKLVKDGPTTKKVTVGVAKEDDATRIMHRLNGTYVGGLQIYIEPLKMSKSGNNSDMESDYQDQSNQQPNQMAGYQQPNQSPWGGQQMGMSQYGYGMPTDSSTGYQAQQGTNQQGMNQQTMGYGYGAWMTSNNPGSAPMMQNSFMGYGNPQGQQGQQSSSSQGQFGGSVPGSQSLPSRPQKELGFGYATSKNDDRERSPINERGYGSQASYSGNQRDREPQGSWRDSQQDRGRPSQGPWSGADDRGDSRGYGSGNFEKRNRWSDNDPKDARGNVGQQPYNQRETGFGSKDNWGNSNRESNRFDRSDDRKRRHSPERGDQYRGNSRDRFQGGSSKFEGNQGRGFDSNRDARDSYNRAGSSRESYTAQAPVLEKPSTSYSWSNKSNEPSRFNDKPRPFGGDQSNSFGDNPRSFAGDLSKSFIGNQSRSFDEKPRPFGGEQSRSFDNRPASGPNRNNNVNNSKPRVVWNSKYQPPQPPSSQASPRPPPEKRPKFENKPVVKESEFDQKTANRAISWRGEGISMLAKEIYQRLNSNHPLAQKGQQAGLKLLKKTLNTRIEEIIKQKHPGNPYPLLRGPDIVQLYRAAFPVRTDDKLCASCAMAAPATGQAKPKAESNSTSGPSTSSMKMQPGGPKMLQPKQEVKPFPPKQKLSGPANPMPPPSGPRMPLPRQEVKPFPPKRKLTDLLPPHLTQQPPRPKLMLGPNALKKKPKPYNVEKRARSEQKNKMKREFLEDDLYKCPTPEVEKALNAVMDEINDVFNKAVDEHPAKNKEEKLVGDTIKLKAVPEMRSVTRVHTIKRLLNITNTLVLRIFVTPGKASKENVEQALKQYGVVNLKSSSQSKTPMFTAGVKSYYNFDRLCTTAGIPVQGRTGPAMITAKPLYLTMPFKFRRLIREKQYAELTGDHDEQDDIGANIKDEDDDYDDDPVEVKEKNDIIELSGDETQNAQVKEETPEVKTEGESVNGADKSEEAKESTVDLTIEDENVDLTVDEKMSEGIAEQMGDSVVEIDDEEIREDDLEDY